MNYVLWIFYGAIVAAAWAYVFALGDAHARNVLTLGLLSAIRRPHLAARSIQVPDRPHKRRHRTFTPAPAAYPPPRRSHIPIMIPVPDTATDDEIAQVVDALNAAERFRGVAPVPDPVLTPGGAVEVQHTVLYDEALEATSEYRRSWENFPDRLLATLNGRTGAIQLSGWGPGDWKAA